MFGRQPRLNVRPPAVAGSFYPLGSKDLTAAVDALLSQARPCRKADLLGIVAPHAGYMYSGPIAASAFAEVAASGKRFERVLLIGPPHYALVSGVAAPSVTAFATPLGEVEVDRDAIATLLDAGLVTLDDRAHGPEHSLEVELPLLQRVLRRFALVPLLIGNALPQNVASAIGTVLDEHTLIVVSTDLSHYLDDASARARDLASAQAIERLDFVRLGPQDACGFAALNGALCAGKSRDWKIARLDLRNSGDTSGNRSRVVGYGAWSFSAAPPIAA